MHFRYRKNVVQLVRTLYNQETKKPKTEVVGRIPLADPVLTKELSSVLTSAEIAEVESWIKRQHRTTLLREELAALTLSEALDHANRWFVRQGESAEANEAAANLLPALQALRKTLKSNHLLG